MTSAIHTTKIYKEKGMKTLFAAFLLVVAFGSFASENQASDCPRTLHSDERENTKSSSDVKEDVKSDSGAIGM
jgi:hypothetical protein